MSVTTGVYHVDVSDDLHPVDFLRAKADNYARLAAEFREAADALERKTPVGGQQPAIPIRVRPVRRVGGGDPKRSTMAMIEAVLGASGEPLDAVTLTEQMQRHGWETESVNPLNTVRTALARLADRGQVQRTDNGGFVWGHEEAPEPTESEATPQQEVFTAQE